jgi:hypothetical protein
VVKKRLDHPDSFELVRTTTSPVGGDKVTIIMNYREIKGSGPTPRTSVAIGKVTLLDCAVKIDLMT